MSERAFSTYIVTNKYHGTLYTGHTDNLHHRIEQHIDGTYKGFSRKYGCKHLVWYEDFTTRDEAFRRERTIKNWKRDWKIELIEKTNPHWIDIHNCTYWPLPDTPELQHYRDEAYSFAMDPGFRRDERYLEATGFRSIEDVT